MNNQLHQLAALGQSVWLDCIRRDLMGGGTVRHLIEADGVKGMTSNPAVLEQAIAEDDEYDADVRTMALDGKTPAAIYDALSQSDVQSAADQLRLVFESTQGRDGYASLDINPHLAQDAQGIVIEARRLWTALKRPNVMIKVPGTAGGVHAIQTLINEGINLNVAPLFGLLRYQQVANAYIAGLESRVARRKPLAQVVSTASWVVSRIDFLVDARLEELVAAGNENSNLARKLQGRAAIASAKMAYQLQKSTFGGNRFRTLAVHGANVQRLLWASTGAQTARPSDIKYVEALIGPGTVNALPLATLGAYRDHGKPRLRLEQDLEATHWILSQLRSLGVDLDAVAQQLEGEGIEEVTGAFDGLMRILSRRGSAPLTADANWSTLHHPTRAKAADSP